MDDSLSNPRERNEAGFGLMEVIIGVFVTLILCSVMLYLVRLGFAMYKLNTGTTSVAEQLERARGLAISKGEPVRVFFEYKRGKYGTDRNSNGHLDAAEVEDLPEGVTLSEDAVVIFSRTGTLARGSKEPQIIISNTTDARRIKVSAGGAIEVD